MIQDANSPYCVRDVHQTKNLIAAGNIFQKEWAAIETFMLYFILRKPKNNAEENEYIVSFCSQIWLFLWFGLF